MDENVKKKNQNDRKSAWSFITVSRKHLYQIKVMLICLWINKIPTGWNQRG